MHSPLSPSLSLLFFFLLLSSSLLFYKCVHVYCGYRVCSAIHHFNLVIYTKIQEVHDSQSFACKIQLQLITFAMTFVGSERRLVSRSRYQFPFRDSIQHGRAFPSACCISQGNGNRFEERCCETAVGNTPSACMSPSAIGSSLWCPIPVDQPFAPFFRHRDLLNVRFFTVHEISLRRHVRCVVALLSFFSVCFLRSENFDCPMKSDSWSYRLANRIKKQNKENITENLHIKRYLIP